MARLKDNSPSPVPVPYPNIGQLHHNALSLGDEFLKLETDFSKLSTDLKATEQSRHLTPAFEAQVKIDIAAISHDFLKVGDAFIKFEGSIDQFGDGSVRIAEELFKYGTGGEVGLKADFEFLESALTDVGTNFLKLGVDFSNIRHDGLSSTQHDLLKIDTNLRSAADGLNELSLDFKVLADGLKIDGSHDVLSHFTDTLSKLSHDFTTVAHLTGDMAGHLTQIEGQLKVDDALIAIGNDYLKVTSELATLDSDLHQLAGDFLKVSQLFHKAEIISAHDGFNPQLIEELHRLVHSADDLSGL